MRRIAVAVVHGVEIDDPSFVDTPARLLKEEFAKAVGKDGPDPDDVLVIEPIIWGRHLEERQLQLFERLYPGDDGDRIVDRLIHIARRVSGGSVLWLGPMLAAFASPVLPGLAALRYPALRWLVVHFIGDAIAYDRHASPTAYAEAHTAFAAGLARLAERAGPEAPLCILAHSFGAVLAGDYLYDAQESARGDHEAVFAQVRQARGESPLARGETLTWLYTMGNPQALWALRYPDGRMERPVRLPPPEHPDLEPEWVNIYAKEDVIAFPLRPLGDEYAQAVDEDRAVRLLRFPLSWTPIVHPYYWSNRRVMSSIASRLANGWRVLQTRRPRARGDDGAQLASHVG